MTEMNGAISTGEPKRGAATQVAPSYLDRLEHDGNPDTMPEVAREMTILRGAISSVDRAVNEAFEEFNMLSEKIRPLVDEGPVPGDVVANALASSAPHVATAVGNDLRRAYEHVSSLEAQIGTLSMRIRSLRNAVAL